MDDVEAVACEDLNKKIARIESIEEACVFYHNLTLSKASDRPLSAFFQDIGVAAVFFHGSEEFVLSVRKFIEENQCKSI